MYEKSPPTREGDTSRGHRNNNSGTTIYNVSTNGNSWASSANSATNARNLNLNSSSFNWNNNNYISYL